jgi:hypothetical protein
VCSLVTVLPPLSFLIQGLTAALELRRSLSKTPLTRERSPPKTHCVSDPSECGAVRREWRPQLLALRDESRARLFPPSATSADALRQSHCFAGKGLPLWLSPTIAMSYGSVCATALSLDHTGINRRPMNMAGPPSAFRKSLTAAPRRSAAISPSIAPQNLSAEEDGCRPRLMAPHTRPTSIETAPGRLKGKGRAQGNSEHRC